MASTPEELYTQYFQIVERGDEAAARKFLIDNLKEFPQETQDEIIVAFLEEALAKKVHGDTAITEFQKRGLDAMKSLGQTKEELEKKIKLAEIKESL